MDVVLSFAAALVAFRLAGLLVRARRLLWAAALLAFAAAAGAMAWGAAHGWDTPAFRVYYLAGALLAAPLLGAGSLAHWGRRWATTGALLYGGLAVGIAVAMPVHGAVAGTDVPHAQDHVDALPRIVAIAGSSLGTLAVLVVAVATIRRRPLGNGLIVAAVAAAAAASAFTQTAVSAAAAFFAVAAVLLYLGATRKA